ncbi:acetolactate synthase large subunit [Paraburkholderia sp. FT54]|uniref:acetolactate synthase large subunit n=1 Tax=Paraburkholderia sp. FT54 TaxID=3074437 RepID=UPI002877BCBF|nr:acetolactate synthase large subunit [Paraburkholderia sp. FT54]WNC92522.1 acetolactate synthase large subunit [Paraburkholderia sp. FT54]
MNGAESLLKSLVASDVEVCFGNPGTSEMHFVAALDAVKEMRPVLGLQENVVTGAADGYARMAGKPAATLLHLGPGLANGLSNLHNARRASSPIVNIVGDHASSHARYDAPLASDIAGFARPVSEWVHSSTSARSVGADAARAVRAAREAPGQIATLILPADTAWDRADEVAAALPLQPRAHAAGSTIDRVASRLRAGMKAVLLVRGDALRGEGLVAAGKIAAKTGARLVSDTFAPRLERGAGRVRVERLPYFGEHATEFLAGTELLILVGARPPVSFFAYPDKPSWLTPDGCEIAVLSHPHEDGVAALAALMNAVDASGAEERVAARQAIPLSLDGALDAKSIAQIVAMHLPTNAIVADEGVSSTLPYYDLLNNAAPHDFLNLTGGAIGSMMAVSTGAGIACPDRKVVTLVGDGSAMYTVQSLWTQAREDLDIVTVVFANRGYKVLNNELVRVGAASNGSGAAAMLDLSTPSLDWVSIGNGLGVAAVRANSRRAFEQAFISAVAQRGPRLIEAVIE